jgi:uroporphyrinogen-III synthase
MTIKNILISQPEPQQVEKSPYATLTEKYGVALEFRKFIQIEGVTLNDFRKQAIDITSFTTVVFNSKQGADNFFRICDALHYDACNSFKYFCSSEVIANYMQKYILGRRRKVIFPKDNTSEELGNILKTKCQDDKILFVLSSDCGCASAADLLPKSRYNYVRGYFYRTVSSDLSDIDITKYQMLVFFSPYGIKSLSANFPQFQQGDTAIAAMGATTGKAVVDAGLRLDVAAPAPEALSMPVALDLFLSKQQPAE